MNQLPDTIHRVFIDGVRSLRSMDKNFQKLAEAEARYMDAGYKVFNPFTTNVFLSLSEKQKISQVRLEGNQINVLSRCDALILIPGWQTDAKLRLKLAFCVMNGIPIFEIYTHKHILIDINITLEDVEYHVDSSLLSFNQTLN